MSDVLIRPSALNGRLRVPLSKSTAHRALICSALAGGGEVLAPGEELSDDLLTTREALQSLLAAKSGGAAPGGKSAARGETVLLDCRESGSTLRFLIPLAAALGVPAEFTGRGRLPERPLGVYAECLPAHGIVFEGVGLPLKISGRLTPGAYSLPGNVSSQFITGLLLALPLLDGDSEILLTSPLESAGYVDMTLQVMRDFGVSAARIKAGWSIPGSQRYQPRAYEIERDWSQAAFFLAAAALGGHLELEGLKPDSCQGDRAAETLFQSLGTEIRWENGILIAGPSRDQESEKDKTPRLKDTVFQTVDASQIPDLVPALAAAAALCQNHRTQIVNAARLRLKESDRLAAMAEGLNRLGGQVTEMPDGLIINGVEHLKGGTVSGFNDHRVVMALAVAALRAENEVKITGAESIRKSYPRFFADYNRLGGKASDLGN